MEERQVIRCPFCGAEAERPKFGWFAKPEGRESECATVLHCPACSIYWAPLSLATVVINALTGR